MGTLTIAPFPIDAPEGPKAYSYKRFSSPEQAHGDSLRRQTEYSEQVATKLNLPLDDTLKL